MVLLPDEGGGPLRVAYAVGRKVGGAVVRNRVRRRLRAGVVELARAGHLPGGACLVIVRPEAADAGYAELRDQLGRAIARADTRMSG